MTCSGWSSPKASKMLCRRAKPPASALGPRIAGRMPALAERIPSYIDCITVCADDDAAGQHGALSLADALTGRLRSLAGERQMKASPDLNDTLRTEGEAAVRNRLDNARRYQGNGPDADANTLPPLTLAEWLVRDLPEPDHLLGSLLSTTCRVLLAGPTGLGKTMLGLAAAMAMAERKPFLHWKAGANAACFMSMAKSAAAK